MNHDASLQPQDAALLQTIADAVQGGRPDGQVSALLRHARNQRCIDWTDISRAVTGSMFATEFTSRFSHVDDVPGLDAMVERSRRAGRTWADIAAANGWPYVAAVATRWQHVDRLIDGP